MEHVLGIELLSPSVGAFPHQFSNTPASLSQPPQGHLYQFPAEISDSLSETAQLQRWRGLHRGKYVPLLYHSAYHDSAFLHNNKMRSLTLYLQSNWLVVDSFERCLGVVKNFPKSYSERVHITFSSVDSVYYYFRCLPENGAMTPIKRWRFDRTHTIL